MLYRLKDSPLVLVNPVGPDSHMKSELTISMRVWTSLHPLRGHRGGHFQSIFLRHYDAKGGGVRAMT